VLLFFRVYFAFIAAEITNILTSLKLAQTQYQEKKQNYEAWMSNMGLPEDLRKRVREYHELRWRKTQGLDENQILNDLPRPLHEKIVEFILKDMIENADLFSSLDPGFIVSFIKKFKFQIISAGEYVFKKGDLADELYFILEGEAVVYDEDNKTISDTLTKNSMFGAKGVIELKPTTRVRSIQARTDLSLAVLHIDDLREIVEQYPAVHEEIKAKVENKTQDDISKSHSNFSFTQLTLKEKSPLQPEKEKSTLQVPEQEKPDQVQDVTVIDPNQIKIQEDPHGLALKGSSTQIQSSNYNNGNGYYDAKDVSDFNDKQLRETKSFISDKVETSAMEPHIVSPKRMVIEKKFYPSSGRKVPNSPKEIGLDHILRELESPIKKVDSSEVGLLSITPDTSAQKSFQKTFSLGPQTNTNAPSERETFVQAPRYTKEIEIQIDGENDDLHAKPSPNRKSRVSRNLKVQTVRNTVRHLTSEEDDPENKFSFLVKLDERLDRICAYCARMGKVNCYNTFSKGYKLIRGPILNIITLYNFLFLSIYLGFQKAEFKGIYLAMEIITIILFLVDAFTRLFDQCINQEKVKILVATYSFKEEVPKSRKILLTFFLDFFVTIPFALFFEIAGNKRRYYNLILILLQWSRLFCIPTLFWLFTTEFLKKRSALNNVLTTIYAYLLFNHLNSMIFMIVGYANGTVENNWISHLPAPLFGWPETKSPGVPPDWEIYVSASYWSYVLTSHVGVGDIPAVTPEEKVWANVVLFINTFIFAFIFGNLASLVDEVIPAYQRTYDATYRYVLNILKKNGFNHFEEKILVFVNINLCNSIEILRLYLGYK